MPARLPPLRGLTFVPPHWACADPNAPGMTPVSRWMLRDARRSLPSGRTPCSTLLVTNSRSAADRSTPPRPPPPAPSASAAPGPGRPLAGATSLATILQLQRQAPLSLPLSASGPVDIEYGAPVLLYTAGGLQHRRRRATRRGASRGFTQSHVEFQAATSVWKTSRQTHLTLGGRGGQGSGWDLHNGGLQGGEACTAVPCALPRMRRPFQPPALVALLAWLSFGTQTPESTKLPNRPKCPHLRQRYYCRDCGGGGICPHGRIRPQCIDCGGSAFCDHGRRRMSCAKCLAELPEAKRREQERHHEKRLRHLFSFSADRLGDGIVRTVATCLVCSRAIVLRRNTSPWRECVKVSAL